MTVTVPFYTLWSLSPSSKRGSSVGSVFNKLSRLDLKFLYCFTHWCHSAPAVSSLSRTTRRKRHFSCCGWQSWRYCPSPSGMSGITMPMLLNSVQHTKSSGCVRYRPVVQVFPSCHIQVPRILSETRLFLQTGQELHLVCSRRRLAAQQRPQAVPQQQHLHLKHNSAPYDHLKQRNTTS